MNQEKFQKIFALNKNRFYDNFKYFPISDCNEIFKCILKFKFNANEFLQYLPGIKQIKISLSNIRRFYTEVRKTIYDYYNLQYEVEPFAEENGNQYFSCDKSEFSHDINSDSIWVLGMTSNITKDFRVVATKRVDTFKRNYYKIYIIWI